MNTLRPTLVLPLVVLTGALAAAPAYASGGDAVRNSGDCSAASTWGLKAAHDDQRLQVELEVDSNVVGQTWSWRLTDNTVGFASGTATTTGPSGSFTVARRTADRAGTDTIAFRATSPTGEVCRGRLTV